jgi:hypothetical protein
MSFENFRNTSFWGPIYWNILHNISKKIDLQKYQNNKKIKNKFYNILLKFNTILPCETCAKNYSQSFQCAIQQWKEKKPQKNYFYQSFIYLLHSCVNIKTNKKSPLFFDTHLDEKNVYTYFKKFQEINTVLNTIHEQVYIELVDLFHILFPLSLEKN